MSEPLLTVLKLCLLVLLYLFFFRVLRAVWVEVRSPDQVLVPASAAPRETRRERIRRERGSAKRNGPQLTVLEPPEQRGRSYDLDGELTLGRAAGCRVVVDDTYVSQIHARVTQREDQILVEDLGSTNGTYLNRRRVSGPMVMNPGDRLQVGNTVLEMR